MNRQDRRKAQKNRHGYRKLSPEQWRAQMAKNGITPEDMNREFRRGWDDGWKAAHDSTAKLLVGSLCLALMEEHGFDKAKLTKLLEKMDELMLKSLTSDAALNAAFARMGLDIDPEDPFVLLAEAGADGSEE